MLVIVLLIPSLSSAAALLDDFEQDFWLPFTHFNLGDRASAGYASGIARSGSRSYHVQIQGWSLRDFGSAYGYALYATRGASITELRLSMFYDALSDTVSSPWDAFAAGVEIQLLDSSYRNVGRYRYISAYQPSANAGRCGPTTSDVVLSRTPELGVWHDLGRNPAADFPSAPWRTAQFAKIAVGFLCAAGLSGASYSLYFDDFASDTDAGDSDGDGLSDLEEEVRVHIARLDVASVPVEIPQGGRAILEMDGPQISGQGISAALELDIAHPRAADLAITVSGFNGSDWISSLLWDPGFNARGVAILDPVYNQTVHGLIRVQGHVSSRLLGSRAFLFVDGSLAASGELAVDGSFAIPWPTDDWPEDPHRITVYLSDTGNPEDLGPASSEVRVVVDRTAPNLVLERPIAGATLSGLAVIETQAYDTSGVVKVELWVDGVRLDARYEEPYTFALETLDLTNALHTVEARAQDPGGNLATRSVQVTVNNQASAVPPPCEPACSFSSGTSTGSLPPSPPNTETRGLILLDGSRLQISEAMRIPWVPVVRFDETGVSLVLDLLHDREALEADGVVRSDFTSETLARMTKWRVTISDYGSGKAGFVLRVAILLASHTSAGSRDTDSDGLGDAEERFSTGTSPVLRDTDGDFLVDGFETVTQEIQLDIDGIVRTRSVTTSPMDPDTDDDGLADGLELRPDEGAARTDPTDDDTDDDGLFDGVERNMYGSDPTRTDSDGDGLRDGFEVAPRLLNLVINGVQRITTITTSPILADTDDDRVSDPDEEYGRVVEGVITDPGVVDTDEDGLTDYEELRIGVDGFQTNPLEADSDVDGVWDTFDKLPLRNATVEWKTAYPPGLARFDQEMLVFWLRGIEAAMWRYDGETNSCPLLSNDVDGSTKSSVVTHESIVASINEMFTQGGEYRYQATTTREGDPSWSDTSIYSESFGACGATPDQFYIAYEIHRDAFVISFTNNQTVTIADENGLNYSYAFAALPVDLGRSFSIVLQFSIGSEADRTFYNDTGNWLYPTFSYVIFGSPDFATSRVLRSGTVFATDLNEHAYRVELRIPGSVLTEGAVAVRDGTPTVGVYFSPHWFGKHLGNPLRAALDPATLRMASISTERPSVVSSLAVRIETEGQEALIGDVDSLAEQRTDYYSTESGRVYVYRTMDGVPFDPSATQNAIAILLVSGSEDALFAVREAIDWGAPGTWYKDVADPWGKPVRAFKDSVKIVRTMVVVGHFLHLLSYRYAEPGTYIFSADSENLIFVDKGEFGGEPIYAVSQVTSEEQFLFEVSQSGDLVVRKQAFYQITTSEVTTDLSTSKILKNQFAAIKSALRGLGAAAVLATNGREAVIAFREGDILKGLVYSSNAALGVFGIFEGQKRLVDIGLRSTRLSSIRVGTVAAVASGSLMAAYEFHLGLESSDELDRRGHFERSAAWTVDTSISVIPTYGVTIMLSWSLANLGMSLAMPNKLAARITSSPGTAIVFLLEYFLSGAIPSAVAQGVLNNALDITVKLVQSFNGVFGIPSVPIFP